MMMYPPDYRPVGPHDASPPTAFDKILRSFSVIALLMTVPQVLSVWSARDVGGVSMVSWATYLLSACLWFVYGWRKRDKTIYLACIGWIVLDAAIVAGAVIRAQ